MTEFKVNNLITLKLENYKTIIYVKEERFLICKHLIFNISINKISFLDEIMSVDEVVGRSNKKQEIPPEVEFWAHCSNLQAWAENNYDTRLLHSNIAFPLLKKLAETGDLKAERVFKEEIAQRFSSGYYPTAKFLYEEEYLEILTLPELESLIQDCYTAHFTSKNYRILLQKIIMHKINQQFPHGDELRYFVEEDEIVDLKISRKSTRKTKDTKDIFCLQSLTNLKALSLSNFEKCSLCEFENLENLEKLILLLCNVKEIKCLNSLSRLKILELNDNKIMEIDGLNNLENLERLYLINNQIKEIKNLERLENLHELNLTDNKIKRLNGINSLVNLRKLWLDYNEISEITDLKSLTNLKYLNLSKNQIEDISQLKQLKKLEVLQLRSNKINNIDSLKFLRNLERVDLKNNHLSDCKINEFLEKIGKKETKFKLSE